MKDYSQASVASFPDRSTIQFLITCTIEKRSGRSGNIYHAYLDRKRGGKGARPNNNREVFMCGVYLSTGIPNNCEHCLKWRTRAWNIFFHLLLPVYLDRHWLHSRDKCSQTLLSTFEYCTIMCKRSIMGRSSNQAKPSTQKKSFFFFFLVSDFSTSISSILTGNRGELLSSSPNMHPTALQRSVILFEVQYKQACNQPTTYPHRGHTS